MRDIFSVLLVPFKLFIIDTGTFQNDYTSLVTYFIVILKTYAWGFIVTNSLTAIKLGCRKKMSFLNLIAFRHKENCLSFFKVKLVTLFACWTALRVKYSRVAML